VAIFSQNVSGLTVVLIPLAQNLSDIRLTNAYDGQVIILEFENSGGFSVASSSIPNLQQPSEGVSFQQFIYSAASGEWVTFETAAAGSYVPQFGSYLFSVVDGLVQAINLNTGNVDYSNADAAVVVNSVLTALATVGGRLFFLKGVYPINSMTQETATGGSNFNGSGAALCYAFGIPANTLATSVQWIIEGETTSVWQGEDLATTINAEGVVFNVTPTAVASVAAGSVLAGWFIRPVSTCSLTAQPFSNVSNQVFHRNTTLRFPTNQRGNTIAYASYFGICVGYENVVADFNLPYNSIATGSAPVAGSYGSFGITSTVSGSGNWQHFVNTYATGYVYGYDVQSELTYGDGVTSIYCTHAGIIGRSSTAVFHPIIFPHIIDQECINGWTLGAEMQAGTRVDFENYDMEVAASGTFARSSNLTETNSGNTSGVLRVTVVKAGTGIVNEAAIWASGGIYFRTIESGKIWSPGLITSAIQSTPTTGLTKQSLITATIPAGPQSGQGSIFWNNPGATLRVKAWGITAANSDSKTVELDFGGATVATITSTVSSGAIELELTIVCGPNNVQECIGKCTDGTQTVVTRTAPAITASAAITLALAATTPTNAGDFTFTGWTVEYDVTNAPFV
jgi:hypothetical protein